MFSEESLSGKIHRKASPLSLGRRTTRLAFCFLYTDLSNPASNSIYQRIGYRPVRDVTDYNFDDASDGA